MGTSLQMHRVCSLLAFGVSLYVGGCEETDERAKDDSGVGITAVDTGHYDSGSNPRPDRHQMMQPMGAVEGRVVAPDQTPLPNLRIACCTLDLCVTGDTDSDGKYFIDGLDEGPRKMLVNDPTQKHMNLVYYQFVPEGETSKLDRDIILPLRTNPRVTWPPETGGTASFLDGQLTLDAEPNSLIYPPSTSTLSPGLYMERVAAQDLPPYPQTPWTGREVDTHAYVINPTEVKASKPVRITVLTSSSSTITYDIWTLNTKSAQLEKVGATTLSNPGQITTHPDSAIKKLTTIILVPNSH